MEQLKRIARMEAILDRAEAAVQQLSEALEAYEQLLPELRELERYYEDGRWQQDFTDDSEGRLPPELKRGVLSEDGVYDLLMERDELYRRLHGLTEEGGHA